MKVCDVCGRGENPLNKLRFRKAADGKAYCADHDPASLEKALPSPVAPHPLLPGRASAGPKLVVITCPECRGMSHRPHGKPCEGCAGYGSVRIPENNLVVYRPTKKLPEDTENLPKLLTEG